MTDAGTLRLRRLGSAAVFLALFAVLAVGTAWGPLQRLDARVARRPHDLALHHHWLAETCKVVARVFEPDYVLVVVLVAGIVLAWKGYRRAAGWTVGVVVVARLAALGVKLLVDRPRPHWTQPVQVIGGSSYPSSHATTIAAAAGVVVALSTMLLRKRGVRRLLAALAVLVVLVVSADRMLLGVHYLSDVVGGWLLGAGVVLLGLGVFDPTPRSIALTAAPLPAVLVAPERDLAVVLNPVKIDDPGQFRSMVEAMAAESGFRSVRWWQTTVEDTGHSMAHEAAVSGASTVLVVGGDGTIRAVCEELAGTGVPVGIVPAGTGNLLARNLGIPLYLRAAIDVGLNGQDRAIDMVAVSGDDMEDATFLVMAGMGFDAAIMEGVNEGIKAKVGWLAYVWSALKSLMFPAMRMEISIDDGEFTRHRARTVVIGNVGYLQAGMPLLPDARIDDGLLDVVLLYPRRFLSWLPLAARVLTRNKRSDETITRMTGRSVVVRASTPTPREFDGDLIAPGRELRAECIHGRLLVRVPR